MSQTIVRAAQGAQVVSEFGHEYVVARDANATRPLVPAVQSLTAWAASHHRRLAPQLNEPVA